MRRLMTVSVMLATLAGCADYGNKTENEFGDYTKDLIACGGSPVLNVSFQSLGYAIAGGAVGALEGATTGAFTNSSAAGAMAFGAIGGAAGLIAGAYSSITEHSGSVDQCMYSKGYRQTEPNGDKDD